MHIMNTIARIESECDRIRSMCQQLEQAERSNQQMVQQMQSVQSVQGDPNVRSQLQNLAQKEASNAQQLAQISQIASTIRQEVSQLRQQAFPTYQPQFQQPAWQQPGIQVQPVQPAPFQQPIGYQPSATQEWVQRHAQPGLTPNQALNILQQGVPQQGIQPVQAVPPAQTVSPMQPTFTQPNTGLYRSLNPYYQH